MTSGRGFTHRIIGAYAPWNPGVNDGDFWVQVAKVFQGSQHSWTLASDLNATISSVECPSGVPMLMGNLSGFSTKLMVSTYGRHSLIKTEREIGCVGHAAQ
jgi:hypothetical protein